MDNINDLFKGILPEAKPLNLPDDLPADLQVQQLAVRATKAVLDKPDLSSVDAPLLEALTNIRNSYMEF